MTHQVIKQYSRGFEARTLGIKKHSNFCVFSILHKEANAIEKDIQYIHKTVGPALSRIYSKAILDKIMIDPDNTIENRHPDTFNKPIHNNEESKSIFESDHSRGRKRSSAIYSSRVLGETQQTTSALDNTFMSSIARTTEATGLDITEFKKTISKKNIDDSSEDDGDSRSPRKVQSSIDESAATMRPNMKEDIMLETKSYQMVTVLAAFSEDFQNQNKYCQRHIDFLFRLRDRYEDARGEIDHYITQSGVYPSESFLSTRVIPDVRDVEKALQDSKLDKLAKLHEGYELKIDIKATKKYASKFFEKVLGYKMPRI